MKKTFLLFLVSIFLISSILPISVSMAASEPKLESVTIPVSSLDKDSYLTLEKLSTTYHVTQIDLLAELNKGYSLLNFSKL